jgi:hypothetical protein
MGIIGASSTVPHSLISVQAACAQLMLDAVPRARAAVSALKSTHQIVMRLVQGMTERKPRWVQLHAEGRALAHATAARVDQLMNVVLHGIRNSSDTGSGIGSAIDRASPIVIDCEGSSVCDAVSLSVSASELGADSTSIGVANPEGSGSSNTSGDLSGCGDAHDMQASAPVSEAAPPQHGFEFSAAKHFGSDADVQMQLDAQSDAQANAQEDVNFSFMASPHAQNTMPARAADNDADNGNMPLSINAFATNAAADADAENCAGADNKKHDDAGDRVDDADATDAMPSTDSPPSQSPPHVESAGPNFSSMAEIAMRITARELKRFGTLSAAQQAALALEVAQIHAEETAAAAAAATATAAAPMQNAALAVDLVHSDAAVGGGGGPSP